MISNSIKLGIASSVFLNYSIHDTIVRVADLGYDGIDVWGGRPHVYRCDYSRVELNDLKQLILERHLVVPSFMPAFFRYPFSLSNPNEIVRRDSVDYSCQCVENAAALGADTVLVIPGKTMNGQSRTDAWKRLLESIERIASCAGEHKIKLGIEPANAMVTDLVNTSADALEIINTLGKENLGVVLDTGHLNLTREPLEQAIKLLGSSLIQIHLNDNDGRHQQNLIPGDGTFDFEALANTLAETRFTGFLSVELAWDYTSNPIPAVEESAKRSRAFLAKWNAIHNIDGKC